MLGRGLRSEVSSMPRLGLIHCGFLGMLSETAAIVLGGGSLVERHESCGNEVENVQSISDSGEEL